MGNTGKTFALSLLLLSLTSMVILPSFIVKAQTRTLVVPDQYPTIQGAINHANAGDTVYVKTGTYFETLVIDKPLTVIGQNRTNTIINANQALVDIVTIRASNVTFTGFTVENCGGYVNQPITQPSGIVLENGEYCNISDNILAYIPYGVGICIGNPATSSSHPSNGNTIEDNFITAGGLRINNAYNNLIARNIAYKGAEIYEGSNNNIIGNYFTTGNSSMGLEISASSNNTIVNNTIAYNQIGIAVWGYDEVIGGSNESYYSENNLIYRNDFVCNEQQTLVSSFSEYGGNVQLASLPNYWDYEGEGNYWSDYLTRYPNASEIDSTGIGNTPYALYGNGGNDIVYFDNYPLMRPSSNGTIIEPSPTLLPLSPSPDVFSLSTATAITTIVTSISLAVVIIILLMWRHKKANLKP